MRIKTICSLQTRKAMACARNRANWPWMKSSTCRTAHTWKNMIRGSWLDVSLFSHVGKAIRDIWLVYIGLRTKIYSAAFQCVNLSMYIIIGNNSCFCLDLNCNAINIFSLFELLQSVCFLIHINNCLLFISPFFDYKVCLFWAARVMANENWVTVSKSSLEARYPSNSWQTLLPAVFTLSFDRFLQNARYYSTGTWPDMCWDIS